MKKPRMVAPTLLLLRRVSKIKNMYARTSSPRIQQWWVAVEVRCVSNMNELVNCEYQNEAKALEF